MSKVLAVDIGWGYNKVCYGSNNRIETIYKFPSVLAEVEVNELVKDKRVITYEGKSYYIGEDALNMSTSSIIDLSKYEELEFYAPVFVYKALSDIGEVPDKIVLGLSIAQIEHSGHYKDRVTKFLRNSGVTADVVVVPQGLMAKLAIDKYGVQFPTETKMHTGEGNYVLCDLGFNTLDLVRVVNGEASTSMVVGIPDKGAIIIVNSIRKAIKDTKRIDLTISEGREVLDRGYLRRRGHNHDMTTVIEAARNNYIKMLQDLIEESFGDVLDKVDNLVLVGGGSYSLAAASDDTGFVKSPSEYAEFYNSIGFFLFGGRK